MDDQQTGMSMVFNKVERYFEDFEVGVNKDATETSKGAVWTVEPDDNKIAYLKAMNAQGNHIYIRPTFEKEDRFMMHDDLDRNGLEKHHKTNGQWKPGRMVVETSPGNYQVWIKSGRPLSNEEKKHWLKKMDSDPGASPKHRWGRCPGFRNRKEKYRNEKGYPFSKMVWVDWKNKAHVPKVELEQPEINIDHETKRQPDTRNYNSNNLPTRADYFKGPGKESEQDFSYAMALLRRNVPRDIVEQRIREERTDWSNHKGEKRMSSYLRTTLDNAEKRVAQTDRFNEARATKRERPKERSQKRTADYKLIVKDIKKGNQRTMTVRDVPEDRAAAELKKYSKKAISRMGYKNTENLELRVQRLQRQQRTKVIEKHVAVQVHS